MSRTKWHRHCLCLNDGDEKILQDLKQSTGLGPQAIYRNLLLKQDYLWTYTPTASVKNLKRDLEVACADHDSLKGQVNMLLDERARQEGEIVRTIDEKRELENKNQKLENLLRIANDNNESLLQKATDEINYAKKVLAEKDLTNKTLLEEISLSNTDQIAQELLKTPLDDPKSTAPVPRTIADQHPEVLELPVEAPNHKKEGGAGPE